MEDIEITNRVEELAKVLITRGWTIAVAESCTGGWLAKSVTDLAGSSQWFDRGFVTYSNDAKVEMLGVNKATIGQFGAVSEQTVVEMVRGIFAHSRAAVGVSISGVAGPTGGSVEKPVGTVWIACGRRGEKPIARRFHFNGDRKSIRKQAVSEALTFLLQTADSNDVI